MSSTASAINRIAPVEAYGCETGRTLRVTQRSAASDRAQARSDLLFTSMDMERCERRVIVAARRDRAASAAVALHQGVCTVCQRMHL